MADWTPPARERVEAYFKELNNWGRWGHDDQRGTVNLITPAKQTAALTLARKGRTVSLARNIGPQPVLMYHATFPSKRERVDVVLAGTGGSSSPPPGSSAREASASTSTPSASSKRGGTRPGPG
jgi:hypothetical protein